MSAPGRQGCADQSYLCSGTASHFKGYARAHVHVYQVCAGRADRTEGNSQDEGHNIYSKTAHKLPANACIYYVSETVTAVPDRPTRSSVRCGYSSRDSATMQSNLAIIITTILLFVWRFIIIKK